MAMVTSFGSVFFAYSRGAGKKSILSFLPFYYPQVYFFDLFPWLPFLFYFLPLFSPEDEDKNEGKKGQKKKRLKRVGEGMPLFFTFPSIRGNRGKLACTKRNINNRPLILMSEFFRLTRMRISNSKKQLILDFRHMS